MHFLQAITALLALTAFVCANAITNIEAQRPGPPQPGIHGSLSVSLSGKSGDQQERDHQVASRTTWRREQHTLLGILARNYGKTRDIEDTDDSFAHARWIYGLTPKWSSETYAQWEQNEFTQLNSRSLVGAGARHQLSKHNDELELALGFGLFREREELDLTTRTEVNWYWRVNTYATYSHQMNGQTFLAVTTYIQPQVDDWKNVRVLLNFGLTVNLTNQLDLNLSYQLRHKSHPAQNFAVSPPLDRHKTNTEYTTSIVYRF